MRNSYTLVALAAVISAVSAAPVLSDLVAAMKTHFNLIKRQDDPQYTMEGLPGCSEDPTFAQGTSAFADGEGTYIGSDCDDGTGDNHCWTDYYLVGTTNAYGEWFQAINNIYCNDPDQASCEHQTQQTSESCQSFTFGTSQEISAGFTSEVGASLGASFTTTQKWTMQTCSGQTNTNICTWEARSGCHSIWGSLLTETVRGYTRRSCNSPTSGEGVNMPDSPQRSDGYYTRGMLDFAVPIASFTDYSCSGECSEDYAGPGEVPPAPNGGEFVPWE